MLAIGAGAGEVQSLQAQLRARTIGIDELRGQRQRLFRRFACLGEPRRVLGGIGDGGFGEGQPGVSGGKARIELNRAGVGGDRPLDVRQIAAAAELPGEQVLVIGVRIVAAMRIQSRVGRSLEFERRDHGGGDFILHLKDVFHVAFEGL